MTFEEELARNMRRARMRRDYTQQQLAQKIGVGASCVSQYERGKRTPSLKMMSFISHELNVSLDDLIPYVPYEDVVNEKQTSIYDLIGE